TPGATGERLVDGGSHRCLSVTYRMGVPARRIRAAAEEVLQRQGVDLAPLRQRLEQLHAAYRDVVDGDSYRLCHAPGGDTELSLNGRLLVRVPGQDFARAYFGIWLADAPISPPLREALLGGGRPAS
ncbi:MAG TPA: chalcone isomerase family protein, partial [Gammaproteobacteria bacterium]